jgi:hypothetical protein
MPASRVFSGSSYLSSSLPMNTTNYLSAWVCVTAYANVGYMPVVSFGGGGTLGIKLTSSQAKVEAHRGYITGKLANRVYNFDSKLSTANLSLNVWYHIAVILSANGYKTQSTYINGSLDNSSSFASAAIAATQNLCIGYAYEYNAGDLISNGQIPYCLTNCRVAFPTSASVSFSQAQIIEMMHLPFSVLDASVHGWSMLNSGDESDVVRTSSTAYNMTQQGTLATASSGPPVRRLKMH